MPAKEVKHIDVTHIPELLRLAEEVQNTGEIRILKKDQEELAQITPIKPLPNGLVPFTDVLSTIRPEIALQDIIDAYTKGNSKQRKLIELQLGGFRTSLERMMAEQVGDIIKQINEKKAGVKPTKPSTRKRAKSRVFTKDDPLWNIVGIFKDDGGPTDVSANIDKYLADAYSDTH